MYYLYPDIFQKIIEFLDSDSIFNLSITCKAAYRAFRRKAVQEKISFPLKSPKRLTYDQRDTIKNMESSDIPVKLVVGGVGSGKTIVALSYCLRKDYEKIFITVPPNLITMWKDTCIEYFGMEPFVAHGVNSKYNPAKIRERFPDEKIILSSYKIFEREMHKGWENKIGDYILIIDEAHHTVSAKIEKFKEIVGLSATTLRKNQIQRGIKALIEGYIGDVLDGEITVEEAVTEISHNLEKTVIGSKLPPVVDLPPYQWRLDTHLKEKILGKYILTNAGKRVLREVSNALTHPFCVYRSDPKYNFAFKYKIGRKTHHVTFGFRYNNLDWEKADDPTLIDQFVDLSVKYKQVLSIYEYIKNRNIKEKILLFDVTIEYIPFIMYFLHKNKVNFFTYSSEFSVTDRQKQLDKFKAFDGTCMLISAPSMLGEGHNITEANHIICLAPLPHDDKYTQIIGRCWRYPQKREVYVHHLFNSQFEHFYYKTVREDLDIEEVDWIEALSM